MKLKTWHKVVGVIIVLAIIGNLIPKEERTSITYTQSQKDSIQLVESISKGKTAAEVNLRIYIKNTLNNPKSFDVIEQKTWVAGETIIVMIDYSFKNEMGGTERKSVKAEADKNGNITKVY